MSKIKTYEFSPIGFAQAKLDCRLAKQNKVNRIASTILLLGLTAAGILTVSLLLLSIGSTAISVASEHFID